MEDRYAQACSAYLAEFIKTETTKKGSYSGWYHYIDNPEFHTVGAVATAQMLILIKDCALNVAFDCTPMLQSLLDKQNPDGGWSYKSNIWDSATEPTSLSVQALVLWSDLLNDTAVEAIQKGVSWLLTYKNSSCLWGPIKKKEKTGFIYFSCVALRCLYRLISSHIEIKESLLNKAKTVLSSGCSSLLRAFRNNDFQCGWGRTESEQATLFHTAYTVITLLEIDSSYAEKHSVIKSMAFLKDYIVKDDYKHGKDNPYQDGIREIYPHKKKRLEHTHSVDTYVLLAVLYGCSEKDRPAIIEKCQYFFSCVERTNWYYQGFVTCWRLYDIVYLCHKCTEFMDTGGEKPMKHFKIALTFAGESRDLVEKIAIELANKFSKEDILYDKFHEADFARPQLDIYLQKLYHDCSDLIVVFLCDQYNQKRWCGVEWRAIRNILNNFNFEKIMYVKVGKENIDDISVPGFYGSEDGYVNANAHSYQEISDLIIERYNSTCCS